MNRSFATRMQKQPVKSARQGLSGKAGLLLAASLAGLAACAGPGTEHPLPVPAVPEAVPPGRTVGVLLPLSGGNARLGQAMLSATRMALGSPTAPPLDIRDTGAPGGAGAAAQAALANGDGVILGPLTAAETGQAAAVSTTASVPMLAFTSDVSVGRPGVWALGIAPEQQVERMVMAAQAEGRQHFAAFLPETALGRAMGRALARNCAARGLAAPQIVYHADSPASITQGLKTLSNFDVRAMAAQPAAQAALPPDAAAAVDPVGGAVPQAQPAPAPSRLGPPPFDALLLADTGLQLASVIEALRAFQVIGVPPVPGAVATADGAAPAAVPLNAAAPPVRILGTALWASFAGKLGQLQGAWYAAPDPTARQRFVQLYMARYHTMPTPLSDLAYDASALVGALDRARPADRPNGYTVEALTRPDGFSGVDGVFGLTPDGQTRRDLAIFQIQPSGGGRIVSPAAGRLAREQS
ncbi:penicillin-binding protein activator [Gluconacetobacter liquefaciens]|uniref:Penicillin-binding protein activator n=2 Tax=Gluconacetobacter liquefaciens TaxID=89584 RepID=A0A7W4JM97_GLULI|nr:penicillin-binding protein activator [Gluconacetobacter liquefaciens]MBB2187416.1 penicillin-binding protein activator [Gluconacetobacter liquefaciens]GEB37938.1 penicillin-binding protein activator [Gluconacetobacter liquefaciens]